MKLRNIFQMTYGAAEVDVFCDNSCAVAAGDLVSAASSSESNITCTCKDGSRDVPSKNYIYYQRSRIVFANTDLRTVPSKILLTVASILCVFSRSAQTSDIRRGPHSSMTWRAISWRDASAMVTAKRERAVHPA